MMIRQVTWAEEVVQCPCRQFHSGVSLGISSSNLLYHHAPKDRLQLSATSLSLVKAELIARSSLWYIVCLFINKHFPVHCTQSARNGVGSRLCEVGNMHKAAGAMDENMAAVSELPCLPRDRPGCRTEEGELSEWLLRPLPECVFHE